MPNTTELWNQHCQKGCPSPSICECIEVCACGHVKAEHEYDYATDDTGESYGVCDVDGCTCDGWNEPELD